MRGKLLWLLSFYIDFIFVGTVVSLADYAIGRTNAVLGGSDFSRHILEIGVTVILVALGRAFGASLGIRLLAYARDEAEAGSRARLWPNLLLGSILLLEGLKEMVRWTALDATMPVFGLIETTPLKIGLLLAFGTLNVAAGALLVAFADNGKRVAAAALALSAVSIALSWKRLPEVIEAAAIARRAAQGRAVRDGEIAFLQAATPWFFIVSLAALLMVLALCRTQRP
jgi:hypothetical protein